MTVAERFWAKVEKTDGCWLWTGTQHDKRGYGRFWNGSREVLAHRWAYEHFFGPIPAGLSIDHVVARGCRSRACVNPAHLEPVTIRENTLRGNGITAVNARKTHCIHGHEFTSENTRISPKYGFRRSCLSCDRLRHRITYHSKRVEAVT